jgi:hypothetical protein
MGTYYLARYIFLNKLTLREIENAEVEKMDNTPRECHPTLSLQTYLVWSRQVHGSSDLLNPMLYLSRKIVASPGCVRMQELHGCRAKIT